MPKPLILAIVGVALSVTASCAEEDFVPLPIDDDYDPGISGYYASDDPDDLISPVSFCEGDDKVSYESLVAPYSTYTVGDTPFLIFAGTTFTISEDLKTLTPYDDVTKMVAPAPLVFQKPC